MNTQEETHTHETDPEEFPAKEIMPDRDILMMEKTMSDNKAAGYKPADKKLLRNIGIIVLFLIAMLIVMMVIVRSNQDGSKGKENESVGNTNITPGAE